MSFDLPRVIASLSRRRRRAVLFRPIYPAANLAGDLARVFVAVVRQWSEEARDRILPAYVALTREREPLPGMQDAASDLGANLGAADDSVYRVILRLTPELRDWSVRAEKAHRAKFVSSAKTAVNIDLSTVLSPFGVETTVEAVFERNLSLIRNVSDTTRSKIGDIVFSGIQQRTLRNDIAKLINEAVGIERDRALRIASDQSTKLSASLDQERQQEIGITEFKWVHSGKVHFRPHHKARDGLIFSWDNNDLNGDLPGVAINCGCKAQAYLDLEE